jgi:Domain of unknown function (DUF6046)
MDNLKAFLKNVFLPPSVKVTDYQPQQGITFPKQTINTAKRLDTSASDGVVLGYLGKPVFCDMVLRKHSDGKGIQLLAVLADITQEKNIVTTVVQGRDGAVKEYISDGDFQISIRGALIGQSNTAFPQTEVRALMDILNAKEAINVVSDYFRLFSIYDIVVTSYKFAQKEGFQNVQLFEISAVSDVPIELIKRKN